MNKIHFHITLLIILVSTVVYAQDYPQSSATAGVDRSLTGQYSGNKKKKEKKTDEDYVDESVAKLTTELTLDSFQAAVLKQLLLEEQEKAKKTIAEDIPNESKNEKIKASKEILNAKIIDFLAPEQREKFEKLLRKNKK
jgi:hypothetical protein